MILRKKTTFIVAIYHNFEKRRVDFFQDYPNVINPFQSYTFISIHASRAVFLLCCSTVLSGYCNVSFYLLGILGIKKGKKSNLLSV